MLKGIPDNRNNSVVFKEEQDIKRKIELKDLQKFLEDILAGKIDDRADAIKEYSKKIMDDYNFLEEYDPREKSKARKIMHFIKDAKDMVFGTFFPQDDE